MKHIVCVAVVLLLFVGYTQSAEIPAIVTITEHNGGFCSAAFSPDGTKIVTGAKNKTACVWDATTGQKLLTLQHADWVRTATFSPDGKKIATSGDDKISRIWDADSGKELCKLVGGRPGFSPDGKKIVTVNHDTDARMWKPILIWDAETGKELHKLEGHTNSVWITVFAPDGKKIATTGYDGTVRIWDVESGKELHQWAGNKVAFSPDGKKVVTNVFRDSLVKIWDVESGNELKTLEGHEGWVRSAAFSPDGKKVVTTNEDETARIWDVESGMELQRLQGDPNDRHDWRNGLWDGKMWGGELIWSVGEQMREGSPAKVQFGDAVFSPDGKVILTTGESNLFRDRTARIWDTETGKQVQVLDGHADELILEASFSPDGKKVVTEAGGRTVRIWTLE